MEKINPTSIDDVLREMQGSRLVRFAINELLTKSSRDNTDGLTVILGAFALGVMYARKQLHPTTQQEPKNAQRP